MIAIDGLVDPLAPGVVRSIGQSVDPPGRLGQHCRATHARDQSARAQWIRERLRAGRRPEVVIRDTVAEWRPANEREQTLIRQHAETGQLVNTQCNPRQKRAPEGELTVSGGVNLRHLRWQRREEGATPRSSANRK